MLMKGLMVLNLKDKALQPAKLESGSLAGRILSRHLTLISTKPA